MANTMVLPAAIPITSVGSTVYRKKYEPACEGGGGGGGGGGGVEERERERDYHKEKERREIKRDKEMNNIII